MKKATGSVNIDLKRVALNVIFSVIIWEFIAYVIFDERELFISILQNTKNVGSFLLFFLPIFIIMTVTIELAKAVISEDKKKK